MNAYDGCFDGFRPLTGIMVLIKLRVRWFNWKITSFPSPYGDYGSYLDGDFDSFQKVAEMFPSPYGDYGSYRLYTKAHNYRINSFRPLTGIMVLIWPRI